MQFRFLLAASLAFAGLSPSVSAEVDADRITTAIEALGRLQGVDLNQNAKLKETVFKLLEKSRGTPNFVRLVQQFRLQGQNAGLLEVVLNHPSSDAAVESVRLLLASGDAVQLRAGLEHTNTAAAVKIAEALGGSSDKLTGGLLLPVVTDATRDPALRRQAVRSLAQTADGAKAILNLAKTDQLPDELRFTASLELSRARWEEVQAEAAKVLPSLQGQDAAPLPPIAELLKRQGDTANGAKVFNRVEAGCATCHRVKGEGVDFGPDLSEIGAKLGKDALYEAILDPSTGISFGYEAWQVQLKSGDEAYGLLASETADEIAIKAVGGLITRYKKSDVQGRQKTKLSIMPAGLQQAISVQELVDLVEYLASLKKP